MSFKAKIRTLVVLQVVLLIIYLVSTFALESRLPAQLQEYLIQDLESDLSISEIVVFIIGGIFFLAELVALLGLFLFKTWARRLYVISIAGTYIVVPIIGPIVDHAFAYTIDSASALVTGMTLALLILNDEYKNTCT